ncbi:MAG TPA: hypothetical protein VE669_01380 [Actinomycetota bacterium]|nr:hypothetical protein [Actinomycetota bacterium]
MRVWVAVASAFVVVDLVVVLFMVRRTIGKLRRELDEAKLSEAQVGATDQLIEFRLRQLGSQIEELERAREEPQAEIEHRPGRRRLG